MPRVLLHSGLALILVIAPTLCCCQATWLARSHRHVSASVPAPHASHASCCQKVRTSCCEPPTQSSPKPTTPANPAPPPECVCCADRQPGAPPEGEEFRPVVQPTGELLSLELAGLVGTPEHTANRARSSNGPPGGDVKYAKLFERHVLRC